jgi:2-keto-4-pentenoate hydratase
MMGSVASALTEAWETGQPVAPLAAEYALESLEAAEAVAGEVLARLGLAPCGIRVAESGLVGAMLEGRIVPSGRPLPFAALPHGHAAPALLVVLAEAVTATGALPPAISALHPALDIATSRWRDGPANAYEAAADMAGLGHVVIGRGKPLAWPRSCALALGDARVKAKPLAALALFDVAIQAAREAGGLPQGAVMILVFDSQQVPLDQSGLVSARWPSLGTAQSELR